MRETKLYPYFSADDDTIKDKTVRVMLSFEQTRAVSSALELLRRLYRIPFINIFFPRLSEEEKNLHIKVFHTTINVLLSSEEYYRLRGEA